MKTHKEIAEEECTVNPIFLLKRFWYSCPGGCKHNGEKYPDGSEYIIDEDEGYDGLPCDQKSSKCPFGDAYDRETIGKREQTVTVFATREEAEAYGKSQTHNLGEQGEGWMAYCVPASGSLVNILNKSSITPSLDYEIPDWIKKEMHTCKQSLFCPIDAEQLKRAILQDKLGKDFGKEKSRE